MKKILLVCGSLREDSVNKKLLKGFESELLEMGSSVLWADIDFPLYNADTESPLPQKVILFKEQIVSADLIIIGTPEYNRGTTGVLKNAIDWASRPKGNSSWFKKKVLVISASSGSIGGAFALYAVKQSLLHLNAEVPGKPEFILGNAYEKFDERGALVDEATRTRIKSAIDELS